MSKGLKLSEILVTVLISVVFAVIYNLWWFVYNGVQATGLHLEQLTNGVWFMAAIVCYLIIPKPGIALLAEFAAGAGKTIIIGSFDIPTIVYAFIQGLACELVFAIFKYQLSFSYGSYVSRFLYSNSGFPYRLFLWLFK